MNIKEIEEKLKAAPYFTQVNVTPNVYDSLVKLRTLLCERGEDDEHLLNNGNVTGVWYLTALTYDGNPQLIVRTTISKNVNERRAGMPDDTMLLEKEIWDIVHQDIVYNYDRDVLGGDSMVKGVQEELVTEILEGNVVLVYDKERGA